MGAGWLAGAAQLVVQWWSSAAHSACTCRTLVFWRATHLSHSAMPSLPSSPLPLAKQPSLWLWSLGIRPKRGWTARPQHPQRPPKQLGRSQLRQLVAAQEQEQRWMKRRPAVPAVVPAGRAWRCPAAPAAAWCTTVSCGELQGVAGRAAMFGLDGRLVCILVCEREERVRRDWSNQTERAELAQAAYLTACPAMPSNAPPLELPLFWPPLQADATASSRTGLPATRQSAASCSNWPLRCRRHSRRPAARSCSCWWPRCGRRAAEKPACLALCWAQTPSQTAARQAPIAAAAAAI